MKLFSPLCLLGPMFVFTALYFRFIVLPYKGIFKCCNCAFDTCITNYLLAYLTVFMKKLALEQNFS